jgi:hypothetical protein
MQQMRMKSLVIVVIAAALVASAALVMRPHGQGIFAKVAQMHGR